MRNYGDLSVCELREMCVSGELNADLMSLSDYERLFDYETDLDEPQSSVLIFCSNGLNKHEAYGKHLPKPSIESVFEKHEQMFGGKPTEPKAKKRRFVPTSRWGRFVATITICITVGLIALQGVAMAMGYDNFVAWIRSALRSPESVVADSQGVESIFTEGVRFYTSTIGLLETENLDVLFPAMLPEEYGFTNFEVDDSGNHTLILLSATEPFISYGIRIGVNIQLDSYDYEINGICFRILEIGDDLHQADFIYEADYYTIVVGDKDILSEIINNLARE
jgi:hypothetical protein